MLLKFFVDRYTQSRYTQGTDKNQQPVSQRREEHTGPREEDNKMMTPPVVRTTETRNSRGKVCNHALKDLAVVFFTAGHTEREYLKE